MEPAVQGVSRGGRARRQPGLPPGQPLVRRLLRLLPLLRPGQRLRCADAAQYGAGHGRMGPRVQGGPVRRIRLAGGEGPPARRPDGACRRGEKRLRPIRPHRICRLPGEKIFPALRPVGCGQRARRESSPAGPFCLAGFPPVKRQETVSAEPAAAVPGVQHVQHGGQHLRGLGPGEGLGQLGAAGQHRHRLHIHR